ncbi:hypothetical protein JCM33374_g3653 [Metschnikowia sp. JCM 33374]|nr:hypothetical protein JCM33374_g3653 [Metschnikowia sp. JCM 33374]
MLHSPENLSPKQKSNWRDKLWRMSSSSSGKSTPAYASLQRTPKGSPRLPSLSNSPTSTPGSVRHIKQENELFLTPLDVLDHDNEVNNLLDNQIGMVFGDWNIPPPPPRKKSGPNTAKLQLLPAKTVSGPKIKPYFTTSSRIESNINNETCFICKDVLETKLDSEKLVPLECGDCIHGECLRANVDILLEKSIKAGTFTKFSSETAIESKVLPVCRGRCCVSEGRHHPVNPMEKEILSDLMADVMLSVKLSTISTESPHQRSPTPNSLVYGVGNRVSRYYFKDNQSLRPISFAGRFSHQSQMFSNEIQESLVETTAEESEEAVPNSNTNMKSLEEVKNIFIKHMINSYSDFNLVVLVSLGSLRLVDRLQVAYGGSEYSQLIVYLFSNFIVMETEGPSPTLFPLNGDYTITTPETSVIQFVTTKGQVPTLKLNSEIDAVIEKWGIALSDISLLLPSDVITSSIDVSDFEVEASSEVTVGEEEVSKDSPQRANFFQERADPRISSVSIIEPREIWRERSDNFEEELMKIGLMPFPEPHTNLYDTEPTSPLNIIRPQRENILPISLADRELSDKALDSDNDSDSDSDIELINEVMHKHRI